MTRLWNVPADFAGEMAKGFVRAHGRWVRAVPGGVARASQATTPEVAVVIGGGSGHYPTFGGLVGPGLAHAAAMGNLFASPSAHQVESVTRASETGRGALLSYGNYAGDVLQFDQAQEALRRDGIDCRTVVVTDDIFSASPEEREKRRGIAGDLTVFKVAGAASSRGYDLDGVERVARLTNDRTRSMGVAFTGCTLPGASEPLFTVPEGRMAIGLGIHGEPGIDEVPIPTADELAQLFVQRLLAEEEIPSGVTVSGARVVPILNGLGSVKTEELFVVFNRVAELLEDAGVELVDPQVGEFCTSFDMAGASLTLLWVDDELEKLWLAPCDTPAFRTGNLDDSALEHVESPQGFSAPEETVPEASEDSQRAARTIATLLTTAQDTIDACVDELGRIDAIAGDGDHGIGMQRGVHAAADKAQNLVARGAGAHTVLELAADAWADAAGGASGALWGLILRTIGGHVGDSLAPDAAAVATGVVAAKDAVMRIGKAKVGDKTMVDSLVPFAETLAREVESGIALPEAWETAAQNAQLAAQATVDLMPKIGRARSHGEKALGVPDPGAISLANIAEALGAVLRNS